jgi:hypothetical protein
MVQQNGFHELNLRLPGLTLSTCRGRSFSLVASLLSSIKTKLPHKSDSTFFFAGSVLVFGREQLPL